VAAFAQGSSDGRASDRDGAAPVRAATMRLMFVAWSELFL
jgi:hypothetical protein